MNNNIIFADIESIIIYSYHTPVLIGYSNNYNIEIFHVKKEINKELNTYDNKIIKKNIEKEKKNNKKSSLIRGKKSLSPEPRALSTEHR